MSRYDLIPIGLQNPDLHEKIRVAVANIPVDHKHVQASYLKHPACSRVRLHKFNQLLNDLVRSGSKKNKLKIDLVVFPEVCIPYQWRQMLVSWSRKHQIGVIAGLEHRIDRHNCALNEIIAVLPYKSSNNLKACMPIPRLKRYYSPEEIFELENNHLQVPEKNRSLHPKQKYHLFRWRGVSFAIYNCYELASIADRGIFKGKVDFIVCSQYNKDVNYFSNIVESAARDLHCYVLQANDSKYGDSRIVSPSKTEIMNPLRIKGGDNLTFLTMEVNLKQLRDHQMKLYGLQKESDQFKPTPPGWNPADVQERIDLGLIV